MESLVIVSRILLALMITQGSAFKEKSQKDFYDKGLELRAKGEWEQALNTWWAGSIALEKKGLTDPRISVAFIELATERKAEKYYGTACELYLRGFSGDSLRKYEDVVAQELLAISPFLDGNEYDSLSTALERGNISSAARGIKQFWQNK
ncbi:MAG: hypothetical protein ACE5IR_27810, partial [bacterium]